MKLIKGGPKLDSMLVKLVNKHENISFAVAWASPRTNIFKALSSSRNKIKKVIIGTHFYQTHPDVLDEFIGFREVRFVLQPQGVFHPKVFLFWSNSSWDILIGSANLTRGALTKNSELLLHVSSKDSTDDIRIQTEKTISEFWEDGKVITKTSAWTYRELWKTQQSALRRISGTYGSGHKSKAPSETEIMTMSWPKFLKAVKSDSIHGARKRCELLSLVQNEFKEHDSFSQMNLGVRKTVAGLPNNWNENWAWFGSMRGAGYYHQAVNENNSYLSEALDSIPLKGAVLVEDYEYYIRKFVLAFPNGRDGVAIASRLLALKRPDYFICLDSKNKQQLCKDFGIKQSGMDYERYWSDVVCRITDSIWWKSTKPNKVEDINIWNGRAAMLDALFYKP